MTKRTYVLACVIGSILPFVPPHRGGAAEPPVVTWPAEWKVFLPVDRDAPAPPADVLGTIPERLEIGGERIAGRWVEASGLDEWEGAPVSLPHVLLDLAPLFGGVVQGQTAYVFLPIESPRAQAVDIGLGADWWMQAWLNGDLLLDTTEHGNQHWPASIRDHRVEARLRKGQNVLAIRFVSGAGSSELAAGGPGQLAALETFAVARPSDGFADPGRHQAVWSARARVDLSLPDSDIRAGEILRVLPLPERQLTYLGPDRRGRHQVADRVNPRFEEPVRLVLSKGRYPAEDGHLDAMVWLTPPEDATTLGGHLELRLLDAAGQEISVAAVDELSPSGLLVSIGLCASMVGRESRLEVVWTHEDGEIGRAVGQFHVAPFAGAPGQGRIRLDIPNETGAVLPHAPFTVGVPFPRGALRDDVHTRLVDAQGRDIPLQTRVSARWSRFGPIKWLLCDFTADLDGGPRTLFLEYGPEVVRPAQAAIGVAEGSSGFPTIEAGRLRASEEGLFYDLSGKGTYTKFLEGAALRGEFIEHEDGRRFTVAADAVHEIEEQGSEKVVVRRTGWYREEGGEGEFCNFVTRMVFHRDSPVVRIYHTWIFTGDGNRDRIANMGWRFSLASGLDDRRLLTAFGEDGAWSGAERLVQWNYEGYDLLADDDRRAVADGRAPGVAVAGDGIRRLYFGAKDFWQNFPSEIGFDGDAFSFYNWPRHNRPASFERPVTPWTAYRHRFAHEGERLDFRLPEEYGGEIGEAAMRVHRLTSRHYDPDNLESANAQGIARTEEMFVYLADAAVSPDEGARVLRGLNDETLRAVVDPVWMTASGVFGRIHPRDTANFPEDERVYELVCRAPARWAEQLGVYGMWVFGDIPAWGMRLDRRESNPYRAYRKNHHGWPYRWTPFARSGDPALLKYAESATRQMADANFCHYANERVNDAVGPDYVRRQGWWHRSILPWAGSNRPLLRSYAVDCDYLWHSYYMTGFRRGKDVAMLWGERVKDDSDSIFGVDRGTVGLFMACQHMYQATFDPWFLTAMVALADLYYTADGGRGRTHLGFWRPADREYDAFSGSTRFREIYLASVDPDSRERRNWARREMLSGWHGEPRIDAEAYAWHLTGNAYYLARVAHELDWARMAVYDGEPEYLRGSILLPGVQLGIFTGWYMQQFPFALGALAAAGTRPDPIPTFFTQTVLAPELYVLKEADRAIPLRLSLHRGPRGVETPYEIAGPDGAAVLAGTWMLEEDLQLELPAELPSGVYRVRVERPGSARLALRLPIAPAETPEVFTSNIHGASGEVQYWFRAPDDADRFDISFPLDSGQAHRYSIWAPDESRAWDFNVYEPEYEGERPVIASVAIPAEHAGEIWRVSCPGRRSSWGLRFGEGIPPIFSVSRQKWFDPAEHGWPDDGAGAGP